MSNKQDHLNQIAQTLVCMGLFMKQTQPDSAKAFLGSAVIACQRDGEMGDEIPKLVFEKVFPGESLPTVLPDEDFDAVAQKQSGQA